MRPGRSLRMVLDGEEGIFPVDHSLVGFVVKVNVSNPTLTLKRVRIYCKVVVLRSYFNLASV